MTALAFDFSAAPDPLLDGHGRGPLHPQRLAARRRAESVRRGVARVRQLDGTGQVQLLARQNPARLPDIGCSDLDEWRAMVAEAVRLAAVPNALPWEQVPR